MDVCAANKNSPLSSYREFTKPDLIIISNDNVESKGHKIILCQISPYFVFLFMQESNTDHKEIFRLKLDFKNEIIQQVFDYAYEGKCNITKSNLIDMLRIADLYNIVGLIKLCEDKIWQWLNHNNCAQYFLVAHHFSLSNKKAIQEYACHSLKVKFETKSDDKALIDFCKGVMETNGKNDEHIEKSINNDNVRTR